MFVVCNCANPIISGSIKEEIFPEGLVNPAGTWAQQDLHRLEEEQGRSHLKKLNTDTCTILRMEKCHVLSEAGVGPDLGSLAERTWVLGPGSPTPVLCPSAGDSSVWRKGYSGETSLPSTTTWREIVQGGSSPLLLFNWWQDKREWLQVVSGEVPVGY